MLVIRPIAVSVALLIAVISVLPAGSTLDEIDYLRQFGYLSTRGAESQLTPEAVATALRRFQRMFRLPETGVMDSQTADLMRKPRCGVKDEPPPVRAKRLATHPRWRYKNFTFLVTTWSRHLGASTVDAMMAKAFGEWKKHADLDFRRAHNPILNIQFGVGSHYCEYPFSSTVLAHAFRPRSTFFELDEDPSSLIGDIHFNDDVPWTPQLLFATAIHEIGHSLGLPHVSDVKSVMYPILVEGQSFTQQDIQTIQAMYGPPMVKPTSSYRTNDRYSQNEVTVPETTNKPQPCTSESDAVTTYRGEFVVFKNEWLWRVVNDGRAVYGPSLISEVFNGLPQKIDAAVEIRGQMWIFSGRNFWIFSERSQVQGPQPLTNLGLPETLLRVRLAYQWHYFDPPATYLWSEHEYWKLDVRIRKVEDSYARFISLNWKHVPQGSTAAFSWRKELYFMQGDMVFRMNTSDYRLPISRGFPIPISEFWPFCERERQSARLTAEQTNYAQTLSFFTVIILVLAFSP